MMKEKHPVYRLIMGGLILVLLLGVAMLVMALILGYHPGFGSSMMIA